MIDSAFEEKVLACLLKVYEFNSVASAHIKPEHFTTDIMKNLAKMSLDFFKKYNSVLTQDAFIFNLKNLVEKKIIVEAEKKPYADLYVKLVQKDVRDYKWVLERLIKFIRQQECVKLIEKSVTEYLPKENFDEIFSGFKKISNITDSSSVTHVGYKDTIDERTEKREEMKHIRIMGIPTGIPALDDATGGRGFMPGEEYLILGPAKSGKSQALAWFANTAAKFGNIVAYFTLEVSAEIITSRLDAMNAEIAINDLQYKAEEVAGKLKEFGMKGNVLIFDYPAKHCSVAEIERQLQRLEVEHGTHVDMVVIDYMDLIKHATVHDEEWKSQQGTARDLRALAKIRQIPVVTASQINRTGAKKEIAQSTDKAGSYGVVAEVDGVITIGATPKGKQNERVLFLSDFRNAPQSCIRIKTAYGFGKFFDEFVEEVFI
jgi:replicative DNA helicase